MTPPEAPVNGPEAGNTEKPPAVSVCLEGLRKRADFLAAARAFRQPTPGFLLQARNRKDGALTVRVGFTASKKVGNAVARNRAKRRLRALAREVLPDHALPGWDYVLVARHEETARRPFEELKKDLRRALAKIEAGLRS